MRTECDQSFLTILKQEYKLKIEEANFSKGYIPRYILLDRTRNIHSYLVLCYKDSGSILSDYWNKNNYKEQIVRLLQTQYSQLDRPLFFIIQQGNKGIKIIESEIIRNELLEHPDHDIISFMMCMSEPIINVLPQIKNEL